jgi:hypothetical protein
MEMEPASDEVGWQMPRQHVSIRLSFFATRVPPLSSQGNVVSKIPKRFKKSRQLFNNLRRQHNQPTMSSNELFKPIGEIASQTDALPEVPDDDVRLQNDGAQPDSQEGEEREVQQIESLCMECGEQVGREQALS